MAVKCVTSTALSFVSPLQTVRLQVYCWEGAFAHLPRTGIILILYKTIFIFDMEMNIKLLKTKFQ